MTKNESIWADLERPEPDNPVLALEQHVQGGRRRVSFFARQSANYFRQAFGFLRISLVCLWSLLGTLARLLLLRARMSLAFQRTTKSSASVAPSNAQAHRELPSRGLSAQAEPPPGRDALQGAG